MIIFTQQFELPFFGWVMLIIYCSVHQNGNSGVVSIKHYFFINCKMRFGQTAQTDLVAFGAGGSLKQKTNSFSIHFFDF